MLRLLSPLSADENYKLNHDKPFLLSMFEERYNIHGTYFFIDTVENPAFDVKHVVFGEVVEGQDLVKEIAAQGSPDGEPLKPIVIVACGTV